MFDSIDFWKDRWIRKPDFSGAMPKTYEAIKVRFMELEKDKTLNLLNKTVLDLGCGRGEIISWLASEKGCKVFGVEIGAAPVEYLKKEGYEVTQADARFVSLERKFNVVISCFLFQHMMEESDVKALYNVILRHLEEKGLVILVDKFSQGSRDFNSFPRPLSYHQNLWKELGLIKVTQISLIEGKTDPCKFFVVLRRGRRGRRI